MSVSSRAPCWRPPSAAAKPNVAVSLANYGVDVGYVTVLPKNTIADECVKELRKFGVDVSHIVTGEGRVGIYFLENGANQLPSKVVYDRAYSAIALAKPAISTGTRLLRALNGSTSPASLPQSPRLQRNLALRRCGRRRSGASPCPVT